MQLIHGAGVRLPLVRRYWSHQSMWTIRTVAAAPINVSLIVSPESAFDDAPTETGLGSARSGQVLPV
jgi:hypothetical protein